MLLPVNAESKVRSVKVLCAYKSNYTEIFIQLYYHYIIISHPHIIASIFWLFTLHRYEMCTKHGLPCLKLCSLFDLKIILSKNPCSICTSLFLISIAYQVFVLIHYYAALPPTYWRRGNVHMAVLISPYDDLLHSKLEFTFYAFTTSYLRSHPPKS